MWTASSALFFAATTMATIGYGNIVPATSSGRIACVVFALFGAPLAIITIGDLGKFLSECTIWLYKEMKKARAFLYARWRRFRGLNKGNESCFMKLV
ncbi:Ion channel [Cooperia oncophora]